MFDAASRPAETLIVGLGNELLGDDGLGVHAARMLAARGVPGCRVVELGTAVLSGLHLFEGAERVLALDAIAGGGAPGSIYRFEAGAATLPEREGGIHALGLVSALRMIEPGLRPRRVVLMGMEPKEMDYSLEVSPEIQMKLPSFMGAVEDFVKTWPREK